MPTRLTGRPSLAYLGVEAVQPPNIVFLNRAPAAHDYLNFNTGDLWVNKSGEKLVPPVHATARDVWMLVSKNPAFNDRGTWINFADGSEALRSLTGDVGGKVFGDADQNINTLGTAGHIVVTGTPATNTLVWDFDADFASQYTCDVGIAIPANDNLNVFGGNHITTTGAGDTITIDLDDDIAEQYTCDTGIAVPSGGNLNVFGDNNITTTGAGDTITIAISQTVSSFTPILSFGSDTTGIMYDDQSGTVTTLGNLCFFSLRISLTSKGTATGIARIRGIPFKIDTTTVSSMNGITGWQHFDLTGVFPNSTYLRARMRVDSSDNTKTQIDLRLDSAINGVSNEVTDVEFTDNTAMVITGTFLIES
jgi:hypothetical protein